MAFRRERNLTLDELAELTGLNNGYLSRIERSEKSPSVAIVLAITGQEAGLAVRITARSERPKAYRTFSSPRS